MFSTLDIPHVFTSDSANRPRLALAPTGFDKWMTLLLLANKPQASKWIQNLAKEMGRRPGMSWPSQTPTHIPRQCFAADLLTQRQARYAYERAIQEVQRAMEEEDSDDEEDTPTNPQYHQYSQVEDDFYHPRTDGKGYYVSDSSVMPQQIQQQVIGPAGGGGIPVQQQPSGLPRWLEVYGGQNVGMFEPGRLQQGECSSR